MIAAPPQVILVPGSPGYYAPGVDINLFVYSGRYYRFHDGAWFIAASHRGPWTYVVRERVPQHVLAVPVTYYRPVADFMLNRAMRRWNHDESRNSAQ